MVTKAELIAEREGWRGKNKYLFQIANKKIRFGEYDDAKKVEPKTSTKVNKPSFQDYKNKNMDELKRIAKKLNIRSYYQYKEDILIKKIMEVH